MQTISTRIPARTAAAQATIVRVLSGDPAPAQAPTVAANTLNWHHHQTATPEPLAIPPMPAVSAIETEADEPGECAPPAAVSNPFAGLTDRAAVPAANDDVAETDQSGRKSKRPRVKNVVFEGRAEMQLRRVVSRRLVAAREASGFGQQEAAHAIGYETPAQLSQWESGRRFPPVSELIKLGNLYRVSLDFLLGEAPEMDRDPAAGLRHAMLRGVRTQLTRVAEVISAEVSRHARLVGTDAGSTGQFIAVGTELLDAVRGLERLNPNHFNDLRGAATLQRRAHEFEASLADAKRRQRLAQALDADLRERLGRLPDGDIDLGDHA
ncbi:helix-turn-helix domain-containing protein [Variovorax sp. RB3P1]|uniref:helix-turn-helix domain-containing protein n=1 Tax=Variovorax sp. RB3P1 TaxID=3443732 RepID=UPI003F459543